jgi:hypothetical protein
METSTALLEEAGNSIHGGAADLRNEDQEGALVVLPYRPPNALLLVCGRYLIIVFSVRDIVGDSVRRHDWLFGITQGRKTQREQILLEQTTLGKLDTTNGQIKTERRISTAKRLENI